MADRDEKRALVDRLHDLAVVLADNHLEVGLRLEEVAHRWEVAALIDDPVPFRSRSEAGEHDGLGDRDVLVHHRGARGRAHDATDLVADRQRQLPPALTPGPDPALAPGPCVLGEPLLHPGRHRPKRVVDQVRRVLEDRKLGAVVEQLAHLGSVCRRTSARGAEQDTSEGLSLGRVRGTVPRTWPVSAGFAALSAALAWLHGPDPAVAAADAGVLPRHLPRRRAAKAVPGRHRPDGVEEAARRRGAQVRLADSRVDAARQPLPCPDRDDATRALERDAAAERPLCDAVQPPLRPEGPSLPGPLRVSSRRQRGVPGGRDRVHLRKRDAGRASALAVARFRLTRRGASESRRTL